MNFYYTLLRPLLTAGVPYLRLRNNIFFRHAASSSRRFISSQVSLTLTLTPCSHSPNVEKNIPTALSEVAPPLVLGRGARAIDRDA